MLPAYQGVVSKIPVVVTPTFSCGPSMVSDIDGNIYNTVLIGTQCWTKENLKVSKYNDGTTIPNQTANTNWGTLLTGALTVYTGAASYLATYGYLYNWYAAKDTREICPTGWHVPTNTEWETLNTYLGGTTIAGGKMKSTSSLWTSPNTISPTQSLDCVRIARPDLIDIVQRLLILCYLRRTSPGFLPFVSRLWGIFL